MTAEDLDALESHPLDAEDEEVVDSVPRCMESVMLDAADGDAREAEIAELDAEVLGLQVRPSGYQSIRVLLSCAHPGRSAGLQPMLLLLRLRFPTACSGDGAGAREPGPRRRWYCLQWLASSFGDRTPAPCVWAAAAKCAPAVLHHCPSGHSHMDPS